jgi:uncharacterized membrane protein HdeD (DUF308 family)
MNELSFHHAILALAGVAGTLEFFGAFFERHAWSHRKRFFLLVCAGPFYLYQALNAFETLSLASSLELFGFIGCVLGCLGAVRLVCPDTSMGKAAAKPSDA